MKLIMLGTGNAMALFCYNTCFVLTNERGSLLVDGGGGNGLLKQLDLAGISYRDLHTIYVTHQHLDHLMGIVWLVRCIGMDVKNGKDFGSYTIYAHRKLCVVLDGICRSLLPKEYPKAIGSGRLQIIPVRDMEEAELLGCRTVFFDIRSTKMDQFGFRMDYEPGKALVCCGDEPLQEHCFSLAEGADFLLHEAFCLKADEPVYHAYEKHHSTVEDACRLGEQLHVKNLLLYHTEDDHLKDRRRLYTAEGQKIYSGHLIVPDDLDTIEL